MVKRVLKSVLVVFGIISGLAVTFVLFLDWKEEWLYEKYGKENVLAFMKRFEPFITMEGDEEEDDETIAD